MLQLSGNALVVGSLGTSSEGCFELITERWNQIGELKLSQVAGLVGSALTLAALLSIDTLKTCVVLDQLRVRAMIRIANWQPRAWPTWSLQVSVACRVPEPWAPVWSICRVAPGPEYPA